MPWREISRDNSAANCIKLFKIIQSIENISIKFATLKLFSLKCYRNGKISCHGIQARKLAKRRSFVKPGGHEYWPNYN